MYHTDTLVGIYRYPVAVIGHGTHALCHYITNVPVITDTSTGHRSPHVQSTDSDTVGTYCTILNTESCKLLVSLLLLCSCTSKYCRDLTHTHYKTDTR